MQYAVVESYEDIITCVHIYDTLTEANESAIYKGNLMLNTLQFDYTYNVAPIY